MKVLIVPIFTMAETFGPISRSKNLAKYLSDNKHDVTLCVNENINDNQINNVKYYFIKNPSPLGLPEIIGKYFFPIVEKMGITKNKTEKSFEEVLFLTGNIKYKYFKYKLQIVQNIINEYKPDLIYSEFCLAAILSAKINKIPVFCSYSFPVQPLFYKDGRFSKDVNKILKENEIKNVDSVLEIFQLADIKFVPSIYELEPINVAPENYYYTSRDGMLFMSINPEYLFLSAYPSARDSVTTLPSDLRSIYSYVFYENTNITSVTIPNGLDYIGQGAFGRCISITSITIPSSVTIITKQAFDGWTSSQTINVQGKADRAAAITAGWDNEWDNGCNAPINYNAP